MRLAFAFLADAATVSNEGLFAVVGGGFNLFQASSFPSAKSAMVLIGRILFTPEECGREYHLRSELVGPEGEVLPFGMSLTLEPVVNPRRPDRDNWVTLCLQYRAVHFATPGDYRIRLSVDDSYLDEVAFEVAPLGEQS